MKRFFELSQKTSTPRQSINTLSHSKENSRLFSKRSNNNNNNNNNEIKKHKNTEQQLIPTKKVIKSLTPDNITPPKQPFSSTRFNQVQNNRPSTKENRNNNNQKQSAKPSCKQLQNPIKKQITLQNSKKSTVSQQQQKQHTRSASPIGSLNRSSKQASQQKTGLAAASQNKNARAMITKSVTKSVNKSVSPQPSTAKPRIANSREITPPTKRAINLSKSKQNTANFKRNLNRQKSEQSLLNQRFLEFCQCDNLEEVNRILGKKKQELQVDINTRDEQKWTGLHFAVANSNVQLVHNLIYKQANTEAETATSLTPLMIAAQKGNEDIAYLLINAGADVNMSDKHQNTALHHASMNGQSNLVKLLLSRPSIDIFKRNFQNKTALESCTTQETINYFQAYFKEKQKSIQQGDKIVIHQTEESSVQNMFRNNQDNNNNKQSQNYVTASQNREQFSRQQQKQHGTKFQSQAFPNKQQQSKQQYIKAHHTQNSKSQPNNKKVLNSKHQWDQLKVQQQQFTLQKDCNLIESNTDTTQCSEKSLVEEEKIGPQSFIVHGLIGKGSFGEVYLVQKKETDMLYAMKVLHKSRIMRFFFIYLLFKTEHNLIKYALTERNVLSITNHPFIVKLNYAFQTNNKLFLILDYCPGGDLGEHLQREKKLILQKIVVKFSRFSEEKVRIYIAEIILALQDLHKRDILFRDLKPENIVLDAQGHARLTDFGLSKEGVLDYSSGARSFCGSVAYLAPEMLKRQGHGKAVDWYLLGVVMYEMLVGIPPYYANNKEQLFQNIESAPLKLPSSISVEAKSLLKSLLQRNPAKRLGSGRGDAEEIKSHKFFERVVWRDVVQRKLNPPLPELKIKIQTQLVENVFDNQSLLDENKKVVGWSFNNQAQQLQQKQKQQQQQQQQ